MALTRFLLLSLEQPAASSRPCSAARRFAKGTEYNQYKQSVEVDFQLSAHICIGPVWSDEKRSAEGFRGTASVRPGCLSAAKAARVLAVSLRREHHSVAPRGPAVAFPQRSCGMRPSAGRTVRVSALRLRPNAGGRIPTAPGRPCSSPRTAPAKPARNSGVFSFASFRLDEQTKGSRAATRNKRSVELVSAG